MTEEELKELPISVDMATVHSTTVIPLKMSITSRAEQRVIDTMMRTDPLCAVTVSDEPVEKEVHFPYTMVRDGKGGFVPGAKKLLHGYKGESMLEFPDLRPKNDTDPWPV